MKYNFIIWLTCLGLFFSCSTKQESELITIDVNKSYPMKKLKISDLADVSYVKLSTERDFLVKSRVLATSDNYIVTKGGSQNILVFDKQGNPVYSFSHEGNGPHEYLNASTVMIDEKESLLYIHDIQLQKMFAYRLDGEFVYEYDTDNFRFVYQFNENHFIIYHQITNRINADMTPYFSIVNKKTGQLVKKIEVPQAINKIVNLEVTMGEGEQKMVYSAMHLPLIRTLDDDFLLNELSSDTIYRIHQDLSMEPWIVRKPGIEGMSRQVSLEAGVETSLYQFFTLTSVHPDNMDNMFEESPLVYDKLEDKVYRYEVEMEEHEDFHPNFSAHIVNCDVRSGFGLSRFQVFDLQEALENGFLHGKLQEITDELDDEDNPLVILYHFK